MWNRIKAAATLKGRIPSPVFLGIGLGVAGHFLYRGYKRSQGDGAYVPAFDTGLRAAKWYGFAYDKLLNRVDPERMHLAGVYALSLSPAWRYVLGLIDHTPDDPVLATEVAGIQFNNPVGLAAGFDKHAEAMDGCLDLGFGFVEIGSVTPQPQPGNPRPRLFRLLEDESVINRYGFNSQGSDAVKSRLQRWQRRNHLEVFDGQPVVWKPQSAAKHQKVIEFEAKTQNQAGADGLVPVVAPIVGVNLGKNKHSPDAVSDYCAGVRELGPYARYLVVNVSSPNTPGLRSLQAKDELYNLAKAVITARDKIRPALPDAPLPPVFVKIAPDLSEDDKRNIAEACLQANVDGLIVSNTTISRPETLQSEYKNEAGGLSGKALRDMSTQLVADMHTLTGGRLPIIGVGGIATGQDAYDKIRAGASLVQFYAYFAFKGPHMVHEVKHDLTELLKRDGFTHINQAVGVDAAQRSKYKPVSLAQPSITAETNKASSAGNRK